MTTINLKRYYPYVTENVMLEVSDEIAAALSMGGRLCDSYKRQKRRNGECSLDTDPGFEADVLCKPMTPDEYVEACETTLALYDALAQLPPTQARRVYQHYFLGMSKVKGRRFCAALSRFPTDNGKPSNLFTPLIFIGGFQMTEVRVGYHKEVKTASFQGKSITVENLTPMLSPKARDKRKREIESCLYEVFVKYAPGRAQMH